MRPDINDVFFNIELASEKDVDSIISLHSKIFNKYIDRELNITELRLLINNGNVLVYKYNDSITGCLIYSHCGKNTHLRYWFVDKTIQHLKGIGKALLFELFRITGIGNVIEVWCRKDNIHAYNIYRNYGFQEDGLASDIFMIANRTIFIEYLMPLN